MEKLTKKEKVIYIVICIVLLITAFSIGFIAGMSKSSKENESVSQSLENKEIAQEVKSLKDVISEDEFTKLKTTVEQDEAGYTSYQKLEGYEYTIKREPDRIYFKSSKADGFYCFENTDENYEHFLEVIEDRMFYSVIEDYNLYCFTPDSINTMMSSGDNYIIFDYDNGNLAETDNDFQKDIIFRFAEKTRLYRLATYLSYNREFITKENLGKSEFATDTTMSGYKYMSSVEGD